MMRLLLLVAGLLLSGLSVSAQADAYVSPRFDVLGEEQGLPSALVHQITQDRRGYLWFGTGDGLVRYDGLDMLVHQHQPDNPRSLPANNVQALLVDSQDRIWVATLSSGLSMMGPERDGFRHFRHDPDDPDSLGSDGIWDIVEGPDGAIWLAAWRGGINRLDPETGELTQYRHDPDDPRSLPSDNVSGLAWGKNGELWVAMYGSGLAQMEAPGRFLAYRHDPEDSNSPMSDNIVSVVLDSRGELWLCGSGGLGRRDPQGRFHRYLAPNQGVMHVLEDARGQRWIMMPDGLIFWPDLDQEMVTLVRRAGAIGSLPSNRFWSGHRDHEGGLWFATLDGGIARLRPDWDQFTLYQPDASDERGLPESPVRGLGMGADGRLLVASFTAGAMTLDPRTGEVERYPSADRLDMELSPDLLPQRRIWAALEDRHGRQWIGHHSGISVRESSSSPWRHLMGAQVAETVLLGGFVDLLWEDPAGTIWASSHGNGLHRFDVDSGELLQSYPPAEDGSGPHGSRARQIVSDGNGGVWLAHDMGVDHFDASSQRFTAVLPGEPRPVFGLDSKQPGHLWVLGWGQVEHYRIEQSTLSLLRRLGPEAGLPAVESGGLVRDARGQLWYATGRGLISIDPESMALRRYGIAEGLPTQQLNDRVPLHGRDGRLYFGAIQGVLAFDPGDLRSNGVAPPLLLDVLTVRRGDQLLDLQAEPGTLSPLRFGDRDLRVRVRALSYAEPRANSYRMRLRGYEQDWQEVDARGERVFGRLPPGNYTLQIQGANNAGVFSPDEILLHLKMPVPPWRSPLVLVLYAMLAVVLAILALRIYRDRIRRRHELQLAQERVRWAEAGSEAKSRFLATFSHEVRTPMTGLLGMTELMLRTELSARQASYAQNLRRSGRMLLRLMDDILDLSRIESGRLEMCAESVALRGLLEELREMYGPLAEEQGLSFRLEIAADLPELVTGDGLRLRQILENLLRNAIKFTARGGVVLRASLNAQQHTVLEVEDTGPGISEEARSKLFQPFSQADGSIVRRYGGSGLGLVICRELAQRMDGRIELESEPGKGTCLRLVLPLPIESGQIAVRSDSGTALVVEDDSGAAALLLELLRDEGVSADITANAIAAISAYATGNYRWVFMDLDLPGLDGFEITRLIRREEAARHLPAACIVAVTARTGSELGAQCRAAGMDDQLSKPVSPSVLRRLLAARPG